MMQETGVLQAENLTLGYGNEVVLRGINLTAAQGDFWFLLGPNGAGKTTLLRAVIGTLAPFGGSLTLHPELQDRKRIGYIPQKCVISDTLPMTVREFVLLGLAGLRLSRSNEEQALADALQKTGLEGLVKHNYWTLSGGQRQRALAARALVRRPSLLILDEATEGLDLRSKDELLRAIVDSNRKEALTVFFVTHDLSIAARYGNRFALFSDRSAVVGTAEETLTKDNLKRVYGLRVAVNGIDSGEPRIEVSE